MRGKVFGSLGTAIALCLLWPSCLPAQCGGGSSGAPTLKTIVIDGNPADWANVLSNPVQVTNDGEFSPNCNIPPLDRDCSINKNITGRDMATFAWTYDNTNIYLYQTRYGSTSNTETFYFYMDTNGNQRMNTGEKVLQVTYSGSNRKLTGTLYSYAAVGGANGDAMVDASGYADGYTLPGTLTGGTVQYSGIVAGFSDGTGFEAYISWTALGVPAGTAIYFHVSSCNTSNPTQVPASIDDNLGGPTGGQGVFGFYAVGITPGDVSSGLSSVPGSVDYYHTITNTGSLSDRYSLKAVSSLGFAIDLYDNATNTLMATDSQGNGTWDYINPAYNTNSDAYPDTPLLAPSATFTVRMHLSVPAGIWNQQDLTVLTATSWATPDCISAGANETTAVGDVSLLQSPQSKSGVAGQTINFGLTIQNYSAYDTFDITAVSAKGYAVAIYSDPDGDGDPSDGVIVASDLNGDGSYSDPGDYITPGFDTNSNLKPDFGITSFGASTYFVVQLAIPSGAAAGSTDTVTVTIKGSSHGATATAVLNVAVFARLTLAPSYTVANGTNKYSGQDKPVFYAHTLVNSWPQADTITLSAVSSDGWSVFLFTDPNGDGNPNDGTLISSPVSLAANGGTLHFVVEVIIPNGLAMPLTDTTTVTATSGLSPTTSLNATDQVRVSYLSVYKDSNHTVAGRYFVPCDTVYALGSSLAPGTTTRYQLSYVNPSSVTVRTTYLYSDGNGNGPDQYTFGASDPSGTWNLQLWDYGTLIDSVPVVLDNPASSCSVSPVALNSASYPVAGSNLSMTGTFNNNDANAAYSGTTFQYIVLNQAGDRYLTGGGTFASYSAGLFTRTTSPHLVGGGASATETVSVNGVAFDGPGVYQAVVSWTGPCGNALASTTVPVYVVYDPPTISGPVFAGATSISGASNAPDGTIIYVYYNGTLIGTATVTAGSWTLSPVSGIQQGGVVTAAAGAAPLTSPQSSGVVASVGLLRTYASQLAPQHPANGSLFLPGGLDPSIPVNGQTVVSNSFASGSPFPPYDTGDLGSSSPPLVYYQVAGMTASTLKVSKSGGVITITY